MILSKDSVGKDILAYCSRCKLKLSHIVISLNSDFSPAKVQCNTCRSNHKYKNGPRTTNKSSSSKLLSLAKKSSSGKEKFLEMLSGNIKDSKIYSMQERFIIGDKINHKKFGIGIVSSIIDNNKISVIFPEFEKTLIHNRRP